MGGGRPHLRLAWLAALMGSTALATLPESALAACAINGAAPNWLCSGVESAGQVILQNDATVTTANGFSVDAGLDPAALSITGRGAISYSDVFGSRLTGGDDGLYVMVTGDTVDTPGSVTVMTGGTISGFDNGILTENFGGGATHITAIGAVRGHSEVGIQAFNHIPATDLTINAWEVYGSTWGILGMNAGTGAISITANGTVTGGQVGIQGYNTDIGTNLTIAAARVTAGDTGIWSYNNATGWTSISASDAVTANNKYGVLAYNGTATMADGAGDGLKIDMKGVSGGSYGIAANNSGAGAIRITAGDVSASAAGSSGIFAINGRVLDYNDFLADPLSANRVANPNATDIVVTAGAVSGDLYGIFASNVGTGPARRSLRLVIELGENPEGWSSIKLQKRQYVA